jgi:hypothetical protein
MIGNSVGGFGGEILWYTTSEDVDRNALEKRRRYNG